MFPSLIPDPAFTNALLDQLGDGPDIDKLFLHTDDQNNANNNNVLGFEQLEPPINSEDYLFSLDESEGISDLFGFL